MSWRVLAKGPWYDLWTFLRGGGSPNLKDATGMSLLEAAVEDNNVPKVNVLIEYGCDVDAASVEGYTPVHRALHNKHNTVLKLLLKANANVNTVWGIKGTPLLHAIFTDNMKAVNYILTCGRNCDINMEETECCHLPLAQAIVKENISLCFLLLKFGASIERLNSHPEKRLAYYHMCKEIPLFQELIYVLGYSLDLQLMWQTAAGIGEMNVFLWKLRLYNNRFRHNGMQMIILDHIERGLLYKKRRFMIGSIIRQYSLATKCSMDNILLRAILDCRESDSMQLQMRKGELLVILMRYGLVIHPQTILKFCRSRENNSACDTCRRAASNISNRIDVPSLKAQSCSVLRQNLRIYQGQFISWVYTWLHAYLPKSLVEFVYMQ